MKRAPRRRMQAGDLVKFGGGFYAGRIPAPKQESSSR